MIYFVNSIKQTLSAEISFWPAGNFFPLACVKKIPFGRTANFSPSPELKDCTPAGV